MGNSWTSKTARIRIEEFATVLNIEIESSHGGWVRRVGDEKWARPNVLCSRLYHAIRRRRLKEEKEARKNLPLET